MGKRHEVAGLYVVGCPEAPGMYKIGISNNIHSRMSYIQCCCPFKIVLEHVISGEGYTVAEAYLHARFDANRQHGEWFRLSDAELQEIKALRTVPARPWMFTSHSRPNRRSVAIEYFNGVSK